MTKFINKTQNKSEPKKTTFKYLLTSSFQVAEAACTPSEYNNVELIFQHEKYGDVFLAWANGRRQKGVLYFGEMGHEFD